MRCEYCQLSQETQEATFHIDHIRPLRVDGPTIEDNLALACVSCSLRKGAREEVLDPISGKTTPVFNPRRMAWHEHFVHVEFRVEGLTAIGRATVETLKMNRAAILQIRRMVTHMGKTM